MRIERTRNRHSRAVLERDVVVIRLARNLSTVEEQRHVTNLLKRMQKLVVRERERALVNPYFELFDGQAEEIFALVHQINAATLRVPIHQIRLRPMKTQWGSCSSHGNITLNTALLKLPRRLLEYVIIHELAHRIVKNHSKRFWDLVESTCPNAKDARKEMRKYRLQTR